MTSTEAEASVKGTDVFHLHIALRVCPRDGNGREALGGPRTLTGSHAQRIDHYVGFQCHPHSSLVSLSLVTTLWIERYE